MSRVMAAGDKPRIRLTRGKRPVRKGNRRVDASPGWTPPTRALTSGLRRFVLLTAGGGLLVLLGMAMLFSYRWLTVHPFFNLEQVAVTGNSHLGNTEILNQAKIRPGQNSLSVNIRDVEKRLSRNPWVESVSVKRQLPGSITLKVREKTPVFWVRDGETLMYADNSGRLIDAVQPEKMISLPFLEVDDATGVTRRLLPGLAAYIGSAEFPFPRDQIAWMRAAGPKGIEIYLDGPDIALQITDEDFRAGFDRARQVWRDLKNRGELSSVTRISVYPDRVWVTRKA